MAKTKKESSKKPAASKTKKTKEVQPKEESVQQNNTTRPKDGTIWMKSLDDGNEINVDLVWADEGCPMLYLRMMSFGIVTTEQGIYLDPDTAEGLAEALLHGLDHISEHSICDNPAVEDEDEVADVSELLTNKKNYNSN